VSLTTAAVAAGRRVLFSLPRAGRCGVDLAGDGCSAAAWMDAACWIYTVIVLELSMLGCSTWVWTLDPLPDSMGHGHVVVRVGSFFF
jgi:hypothetical protein